MNQNTSKTYEEFVLRATKKIKMRSNSLTNFGLVVGGIIFGVWGYHAGGTGGAILFTICGSVFGGMLAYDVPNAILTAFGTLKKVSIFLGLIGIVILIRVIYNSLSIGFLLFIIT